MDEKKWLINDIANVHFFNLVATTFIPHFSQAIYLFSISLQLRNQFF